MEPIICYVALFYFIFYLMKCFRILFTFTKWWWGQDCKTKQNNPYLPHHWLETGIIPHSRQVHSLFQSNSLLILRDFALCLWWTFVSRKAQRTSANSSIPSLETPPTQRFYCILRRGNLYIPASPSLQSMYESVSTRCIVFCLFALRCVALRCVALRCVENIRFW